MRLKRTKTFIIRICVFFILLLVVGHLLTIFLDGELLASQVVPPLPDNRIEVSGPPCLIGSSTRCRTINYTIPESPEAIIQFWSEKNIAFNSLHDSPYDSVYYQHDACNYNIWGINYAVLYSHTDNSLGFSCATVGMYYDEDQELTHIHVLLKWTNCLRIVKTFVPYDSNWLYRYCYNG